jgi:hypothetical protein
MIWLAQIWEDVYHLSTGWELLEGMLLALHKTDIHINKCNRVIVHSYPEFGPENDPYLSWSDLSNLRMVKWVGVKLWLPPSLPHILNHTQHKESYPATPSTTHQLNH